MCSCTAAVVNLKVFDDDVLSVPGCKDMKEKNVIEEGLTRYQLMNNLSLSFNNHS